MTKYDILSILGACAWIPPIVSAIGKLLVKPKLSIIIHNQLEIGYTINGPILNLSLALSSENSECLIKNIEIELKGPHNEQHKLKWQWFEEKLYEIDNLEQGPTPIKKQQNAIAIKVLKESLTEKKIGFQDETFKNKYIEFYNSTQEVYLNLKNSQQDLNSLRGTRDFNNFQDLLDSSNMWKEGLYDAEIKIYAHKLSAPFQKSFNFRLAATEIKTLMANSGLCKEVVENSYFTQDPNFLINWMWIYPKAYF